MLGNSPHYYLRYLYGNCKIQGAGVKDGKWWGYYRFQVCKRTQSLQFNHGRAGPKLDSNRRSNDTECRTMNKFAVRTRAESA